MKYLFCFLYLGLASPLFAQEKDALPEPSGPPFEVGALPLGSGHTIEREDAPDLNFRIVDSELRLYWLDEDGLIVEPSVDAATIRFTGSVRGRSYHRLARLKNDVGLGTTSYKLLPPHLYNVVLVINTRDSDEPEIFRFRYIPSMGSVKDPNP